MLFIYNLLTHLASYFLKIVALFNPKIKLFVNGRKTVFLILKEKIKPTDKTIWIHCASLGEFEQGLPIIEKLKLEYTSHKIVVSFFSPSGYEVKKNSTIADVIVYLPLDTKQNAKHFLEAVHPDLVVFVKYEFWPNYLSALKRSNIKTLLVSAIFRENQAFFKFYGKWMQKYLTAFEHFFVQNEASKQLLEHIGFSNVTVSGDTRFDRVSAIVERDNSLEDIANFKQEQTTIVYGSSWEDDEIIYVDFLNASENIKHIIAPHDIKKHKIEQLKKRISKKVLLYSEKQGRVLADYDVLIIDSIGLLTKVYHYADIAFVGGAFKTGLHNVLEPAVFGIPIVIGNQYEKFQEAKDLVAQKGVLSVHSKEEYLKVIQYLLEEKNRKMIGKINQQYITKKSGATQKIMGYIQKNSL